MEKAIKLATFDASLPERSSISGKKFHGPSKTFPLNHKSIIEYVIDSIIPIRKGTHCVHGKFLIQNSNPSARMLLLVNWFSQIVRLRGPISGK